MTNVAAGSFKKHLLPSLKQYGQYRGAGLLEVTETGLKVSGKHVYSLRARWTFGIAIFVGVLVVTLGTFAPGFLLIYPIVEFWWLKREDLDVPFASITGVGFDQATEMVAVSFDGHPWCSPVVLKSPDAKVIGEALLARLASGQSVATFTLALSAAPFNRMARGGLTFGVFSIVLPVPVAGTLFAVLGLVLSFFGLKKAKQMNGLGFKAARAGIVCSVVGLVESAVVLVLLFASSK